MAQVDILTRTRVTKVGLEATFNTAPSGSFPEAMTSGIFVMDNVDLDLSQEMLEVNDDRIYRESAVAQVHGLKIASKFSLSQYLKATPSANQLTSGGAVGSLTPRILLKAAYGAEHAALGTTINDAAASATSFVVTSVANLKKGTFIAVTVAGTPEWTKITNISTLTVTVSPALSAAPADTAVIRNLYNYCPKEAHTSSLTVYRGWRDVAGSDVTCEYILTGCYGDLTFKLPAYGQLPTLEFSGTATSHTGPAASGSIDTATPVTDEMGAPIAWKPSVYLAASPVRGTRLVCESVEFGHANKFEQVRDGGATETVSGVVNVGGRPRATTAKVVVRYDQAWDTAFAADTDLKFIIVLTGGSGSTTSFWIWEMPRARIIAKPKLVKVGERLHTELMLGGLEDSSVTVAAETGDDLSRCYATGRVAYG